ncbi:hypothetical protein PGIGA_G00055940 [Pangasianodon gigas]|uniref:Uncharacterized protein n=1 Tax=Pangasianodon gigas TaxID=30993 RepID=A0ACC5X4V0_PANGG|nr:hypothetical protein [Pangasianodon gigas]
MYFNNSVCLNSLSDWALPTPLPIYWMMWKETPARRRVSSEDWPCRKRSGPTGKHFHDPSCHLIYLKYPW